MRKFIYSATTHKTIKCSTTLKDIGESIENIYDGAADYVNDSDREWNYDTPERFARAIIRHIENEYNVELTDDEVQYVMDEAAKGDFSAFEDDDY